MTSDSPSKTDPLERAPFLLVLCILTIVGSLFGMSRGWFYEFVAVVFDFSGDSDYSRGWGYVLLHLGTLVGAVAMMNRKKLGLLLYTACELGYMLMVFGVASSTIDASGMIVGSLFLAPSIGFLVMYWLPVNRKILGP